MKYLLKPVDTFFFKNHKSLNPGEDSFAEGIFPPLPGTVYGALRSAYIHDLTTIHDYVNGNAPEEVYQFAGKPEKKGSFSLRGVYMSHGLKELVPMPNDYQLVSETLDNGEQLLKAYPLELRKYRDNNHSDLNEYGLFGSIDEKSDTPEGYYIEYNDLMNGNRVVNGKEMYNLSELLERETKIGLQRDHRTLQAVDGMLYQISMSRFSEGFHSVQSPGLVVDINEGAEKLSALSVIRLGGRGRPWKIEPFPNEEHNNNNGREKIKKAISKSHVARIVMKTPAIWKKGNRPELYDDSSGELILGDDLTVKVLSSSMPRPSLIGGWDMVNNRPKPRVPAVKPGSVLYVEVKEGQEELFCQRIDEMQLTDDLHEEGYGRMYCLPGVKHFEEES